MRVGFGTTVWMHSLQNGHLDGIGVYTQQLWQQYTDFGINARPVAFGVPDEIKLEPHAPEALDCIPGRYMHQAAWSLITGMPFRNISRLTDEIDIFHAPDHHIPRLRRVPVVATIMDAIPLIRPKWVSMSLRRVKNFAFRRASHWAEHVITISEFSKRDIIEAFGLGEDKVSVIPLGYNESLLQQVDKQEQKNVLQRYGLQEGFFIFVGTLQPRKNIKNLIQAHRLLPNGIQQEHPLVIVGRYGWGNDGFMEEIEQLQKGGTGNWLREVPEGDLIALMQSAVSLVYPSLYEGFGLPVLEAFAAGIPVIASNTTSIPEVAGNAALLLDNPLDVEELSFNMQRLVEDRVLAESLIARGRERLQQYSWHKCAEQTLNVYKSIIA